MNSDLIISGKLINCEEYCRVEGISKIEARLQKVITFAKAIGFKEALEGHEPKSDQLEERLDLSLRRIEQLRKFAWSPLVRNMTIQYRFFLKMMGYQSLLRYGKEQFELVVLPNDADAWALKGLVEFERNIPIAELKLREWGLECEADVKIDQEQSFEKRFQALQNKVDSMSKQIKKYADKVKSFNKDFLEGQACTILGRPIHYIREKYTGKIDILLKKQNRLLNDLKNYQMEPMNPNYNVSGELLKSYQELLKEIESFENFLRQESENPEIIAAKVSDLKMDKMKSLVAKGVQMPEKVLTLTGKLDYLVATLLVKKDEETKQQIVAHMAEFMKEVDQIDIK
jgi:hypothetical protein